MRYRVLNFWGKLGKKIRVFFTREMEGSLHPPAKNLLIPLPTRKLLLPVDSPPPPQKKNPIAPNKGIRRLSHNAISKTLNLSFAPKEDFWGKLAKISITFV